MTIIKMFFGIGCAVALAACTDNGVLFRSFGSYDKKDIGGVYKVGAPYQVKGIWYTPTEDYTYSAKGMASWYEGDPDNPLTDNGEVFDAEQLTARHRTLPLPSLVRITNLENGNTAIVRVNDRGPYVHNRLIDVSHKVAEALEFQEQGTTLVQVDILADESRSMKDQLIQAGRYVETPPQPVMSTDEGMLSESDLNIPIYQPDTALTPLYKPVETAPLPSLSEQSDEADKDAPIQSDDALPEAEILYAGGAVSEAPMPDSDQEKAESAAQPDTPAVQALVKGVRDRANDADEGAKTESVAVISDDADPEKNKTVRELSDTSAPVKGADAEIKPVSKSPSVDLMQPITRPQKAVSFQEYFVQAGAFSKAENADKAQKTVSAIGPVVIVVKTVGNQALTIVRAGPFETPTAARAVLDKIKKAGYPDARIISQ